MKVSLVNSNALNIPLADNSVHCVVTSPPYYGLRDYGTAKWEGGNPKCAHSIGNQVQDNKAPGAITSGVRPGCDASHCKKCGAKRIDAQLGLEPTLHEYIENTVKWCAEVHRVLREDGTFWLNLGDSYNGTGSSNLHNCTLAGGYNLPPKSGSRGMNEMGFKPKDLMLVPHRVAIALQEWGWWVRSDIVWHKPNPMPESVTDRPTKAHEYIFLLTKNKKYYYDADAIREPLKEASLERWKGDIQPSSQKRNNPNVYPQEGAINTIHQIKSGDILNKSGRNKRTVWTITTKPYSGAHFATFPPEIPETCIKAGTKEGDIVLDPFGGSGTTAMVANQLGRHGISLDLSWEYLQLAKKRTGITGLQEWESGKKVETTNLDGLPMFD